MAKQNIQIQQVPVPARVIKERTPIESMYKVPERHREEYLMMKQKLQSTLTGNAYRTILFSSPSRGEGTSTVISQFAVILANSGDSVLLIDANLRSPSLHTRFQLVKEFGFADLITTNCCVTDVIKPTKLKNLSVITSGGTDPDLYTLFETHLVAPLIFEARTKADWVLVESSAINEFNDSLSLAPLVDGTVIVLQAERTRWEVAQCARDRILSINAPIAGTVLNRRKMYIPPWLYSRL